MVDLVTQPILNASQIILGPAGVGENKSEVACVSSPSFTAQGKQQKRMN